MNRESSPTEVHHLIESLFKNSLQSRPLIWYRQILTQKRRTAINFHFNLLPTKFLLQINFVHQSFSFSCDSWLSRMPFSGISKSNFNSKKAHVRFGQRRRGKLKELSSGSNYRALDCHVINCALLSAEFYDIAMSQLEMEDEFD